MILNDPYILLSFVNTKLRDNYNSLDALCDDLDYNKQDIIDKLISINYQYDVDLNQFKLININK